MPVLPNTTPGCRTRVAAAFAVVLIVLAVPALAFAADEEEETFEHSVIRGLLGGKARGDIDYRERSPLVIPPSRDLPSPDSAAKLDAPPAWPRDPDRRKQAKEGFTTAEQSEREGGRPMRPDELRRGTVAGKGRVEKPAMSLSDNEASRPLRPSELGETRSLFHIFANSGKPAEAEAFSGEPTRSRMTEPPPGYRTPSATAPYQAPKDTPGSWFKSLNIFDRGLGNDR